MIRMVKLRGPNGKQIAVSPAEIYFLEEGDIACTAVTNIHLRNGKWVTCALSLDECHAALSAGDATEKSEEQKAQIEKWRQIAEHKRLAQIEADAALTEAGLLTRDFKQRSRSIERLADGTILINVVVEPIEAKP